MFHGALEKLSLASQDKLRIFMQHKRFISVYR